MADTGPELPAHLARYVVDQDYGAYTPRDQAVWRHILTRLTDHLKDRAHPSYLAGLAAAGIGVDRIPRLADMDARLQRIGWRAVGVRGFIPPAVFTELQALGVLAIAADIRGHTHIDYTPAPDIVHESAGHAPILADPRYSEYVRRCGVAGFKAIASREDQAVFEAVRHLSVVKEDPACTAEDLAGAEAQLAAAQAARVRTSESARASRLYWWTAEYGLVGDPARSRIYGAGLLSSLGEAEHCLTAAVRKLPLTPACVEQDFDITRMQPQLFVARDFDHLFEVLEAFEASLAWKRGGAYGLAEAQRAGTVCHAALDTGLEISGVVAWAGPGLAHLEGPVLRSRGGKALAPPEPAPALLVLGVERPGPGRFRLATPEGAVLEGVAGEDGFATGLRGEAGGRPLALPAQARLVTAGAVPSVAGGPADPEAWDRAFGAPAAAGGDAERLARQRKRDALDPGLARLYEELAALRRDGADPRRLRELGEAARRWPGEWLLAGGVEELRAASAPSTCASLERP